MTNTLLFEPLNSESEDSPKDETYEDDTPKGLAEYEERYIAFVDILGFKNLIQKSKIEKSIVGRLTSGACPYFCV